MKILFFNTRSTNISKQRMHLEGSFYELCLRYQIRNVAIIELRAAAGGYVDADIQSSEYYRVFFKNKHGDIIHADKIDFFYVVKEGDGYCFVNRQTKYRPEQHTLH